LLVVAAAIFVCCLAIQASTIRLCFGMARDEQLPGSSLLRSVNPRLHTPIGSCLAVGIFAFIPMLQYTGAAIVQSRRSG
jgi:amino acid transporter